MALIGNYSVLNKSLAQFTNGTATAGAFAAVTPSNYQKSGLRVNRFSQFNKFDGVPVGYRPPYTFVLPLTDGGMGSHTQSSGALTVSANLAGGRNLEGSASLVITLTNAQLDQIVSAVLSGTLSIAATSAALAGAAALDADGSMSIVVDDALLGAIFSVTAASSGLISTDSDITALGFMEASAGGATPLSPEGLAQSMFDDNDICTGYSLREALRLILSAVAGKVSGAETTTITFRNVTDDKNRIVATVDANGNRTSLTYDVSD